MKIKAGKYYLTRSGGYGYVEKQNKMTGMFYVLHDDNYAFGHYPNGRVNSVGEHNKDLLQEWEEANDQ